MTHHCRYYYRVPFSETDAMGIVHHTNHARYFERGRVEYLRLVGIDYAALMKRGMHYPLIELHTTFRRPLVFDEIVLVETTISRATRTRLNFAYKIFSVPELRAPEMATEPFAGPAPSVLGETLHCCVNNEGRPMEAEADVLKKFQELWEGKL